jgi:hypothetical protein
MQTSADLVSEEIAASVEAARRISSASLISA